MPLICSTSENWIVQEIIEPVENWVNQQQKQCKKKRWPWKWFCWFIMILIKIITWVVKQILVKITTTICVFIAWSIGYVFGWIPWIDKWFKSCYLELKNKKDLPTGEFEYTYFCRCNKDCKNTTEAKVVAKDIKEANELVKIECNNKCK